MATPRYVAEKVGDRYELIRKDPEGALEQPAFLAGGGALFVYGFFRGGLRGGLAAIGGAALMYRGATGALPLQLPDAQSRLKAVKAGAPTFQNDSIPAQQRPEDEVDEASMASFPASDPPARMTPGPDSGGAISPGA